MPGPIEDGDCEVTDVPSGRAGDRREVRAEVVRKAHDARADGWIDDELVHVAHGTAIEERAAPRDGDARQRAVAAARDELGAVERVDGDVDLEAEACTDALAAVEEWRLVRGCALADDDDAVDLNAPENLGMGWTNVSANAGDERRTHARRRGGPTLRMAWTADSVAWCVSPRPSHRPASRAAASVTRTSSRARLRCTLE